MLRVGLIGENPNDTDSFAALFSRIYPDKCEYFSLIKNRTGGQLDDIKIGSRTLAQLQFEYAFEKPDFVVMIRDLDALESDASAYNQRLTNMYALGKAVTQNSIYLLCIWEMETLLLADLEPVNNKYGTTLVYPANTNDPIDPMLKQDPKGFLKTNCGYHQNDCAELFRTIDLVKIQSVRFLQEFIPKFEKRIQ
jgi:hypothetical protein